VSALVAPVAPRRPTRPRRRVTSSTGTWNACRKSQFHFAGQARRFSSVGGAIPNLVKLSLLLAAASARPPSASQWPKSLCHDNRLPRHQLQASAHRSTSAAAPPMPVPLSSSRILSSPSPCETRTRPQHPLRPPQLAQCLFRPTQVPVEALLRDSGKSPSLPCQTSLSIPLALRRLRAVASRLPTRRWRHPPHLRDQLDIDEVVASLSEETDVLGPFR
jgi:hypothetical protein